jgi:outer membrane protein OmpA-like peptidoglycan-associated protein
VTAAATPARSAVYAVLAVCTLAAAAAAAAHAGAAAQAGAAEHARAADAAFILPVKGLVLTSTVHSTYIVSSGNQTHSYSGVDVEEWDSVEDTSADAIDYRVRVSAPADASASADLGKFVLHRSVRRQDIAQAMRINLFYSSQDPPMFAGQTFEETSARALTLLQSGAQVPYVIGIIDGADPMGGIGALLQRVAAQPAGGQSGGSPLAGMASLFASAGHIYYRGSLRRVQTAPVMLPVLLDGVRVSLPALHAAGTIVNGDKSIQAQFWWLDSPAWPVALKWSLARDGHVASQQVTKIDRPVPDAAHGSDVIAGQLQKACHVELSGIYFNTGSATLLPESQPALRNIAQAVLQSKQSVLEIEGHTDNIGTAQFNQGLSQQRAQAVRQALVSRFAIPPGRLTARGFGFMCPVDSNDTVEGRAHNRRVELACAGAH